MLLKKFSDKSINIPERSTHGSSVRLLGTDDTNFVHLDLGLLSQDLSGLDEAVVETGLLLNGFGHIQDSDGFHQA